MKPKYQITKTDGSPVDPSAVYFILRLDAHGKPEETDAARRAVECYASAVRQADHEAAAAALAILAHVTGSPLPNK